jgi:hypothetical protein
MAPGRVAAQRAEVDAGRPEPAQSQSSTAVSFSPSHNVWPYHKSPRTKPSRSSSSRAAACADQPARLARSEPLGQHETGTGQAGPGLLSAPQVGAIRT